MAIVASDEQSLLREKFQKYDKDGSGDIDSAELKALMADVTGEDPTDDEVSKFVAAVDSDADGTLSFEEFADIYARAKSGDLEFGGFQLAMNAFDSRPAASGLPGRSAPRRSRGGDSSDVRPRRASSRDIGASSARVEQRCRPRRASRKDHASACRGN